MPPGLAPRADEPQTPANITDADFPRPMKAELRGLPKELALIVGAHLVAAGALIDEDPELAYRHAEAARRRAARLPIVREATAETAYAAGEFAVALNEYRALRRMSGGPDYTAVMADCERALGRPHDALRLIAEAKETPGALDDPGLWTEVSLVEAGARSDLGQHAEAARVLTRAISARRGPAMSQARLRYAYAEHLLEQGDEVGARQWFEAAAALDPADELGIDERLSELEGVTLELSPDEDDQDDQDDEDDQDDQDGEDEEDDQDDQDGEDEEDDEDGGTVSSGTAGDPSVQPSAEGDGE